MYKISNLPGGEYIDTPEGSHLPSAPWIHHSSTTAACKVKLKIMKVFAKFIHGNCCGYTLNTINNYNIQFQIALCKYKHF